ncbi:proton-conducting transporter membrane subunit [Tateyamaria sp. ANG-S1]|uniref:complex I subunit 5 family protein n=1 Tax=Tateyamaria sp. ANG-S1 TaxID=1577905 RepID=UPI00068C496E|nr:proton-conducting transporter membrane subunit [Tateyamaria sp. ANG-S1]
MTPDFLGLDPKSVLLLGPLLAGTLSVLFQRAAAVIGLVGMGVGLFGAVGLAVTLMEHGPMATQLAGWAPPLGIQLYADGLAVFMILMTAWIGAAVGLFTVGSWGITTSDQDTGAHVRARTYFWPLWMLLLAGLNALYLATDIFNLFVTLEIVGLTAVGLTALAGTRQSLQAALRYLIIGLVGSLMILLGVDYLYTAYGRVDLGSIQSADTSITATLALLIMLAGLAIKAAIFPLHFWMPDAHSSATVPASAILSALVVKAALYMAMRLWLAFAPPTDFLPILFGVMGAGAIFFGSFQALRTRRLKMLVAYSTVAQVGLVTLVFAATGTIEAASVWRGAVFLMLAHAIAKAAMFLAAGRLIEEMGHDRISSLRRLPAGGKPAAFAFVIAAISLVGLPPSGGFVGKWLLLDGMIAGEIWIWVSVVLISTVLSASYMLRVIGRLLRRSVLPSERQDGSANWRLGDGVALGLALVALVLGFGSYLPLNLIEIGAPFPTFTAAEPAVTYGADGADL